MIKGRKAEAIWKIIAIILIAFVIIVATISLWKVGLIEKVKNLFPGFKSDEKEPEDFIATCSIKIAQIGASGYIQFCSDEKCEKLTDSLLYIDGVGLFINDRNIAYNLFTSDSKIGLIYRRGIIEVSDDVFNQENELFKSTNLPSFENLQKLDGARLIDKNICIDKKIEIAEEKQSITYSEPVVIQFTAHDKEIGGAFYQEIFRKFRYNPFIEKWEYAKDTRFEAIKGSGEWVMIEEITDDIIIKNLAELLKGKNEKQGLEIFAEMQGVSGITISNLPEIQTPPNLQPIAIMEFDGFERKIIISNLISGLYIENDIIHFRGKPEIYVGGVSRDGDIEIRDYNLENPAKYGLESVIDDMKAIHRTKLIGGKIYKTT